MAYVKALEKSNLVTADEREDIYEGLEKVCFTQIKDLLIKMTFYTGKEKENHDLEFNVWGILYLCGICSFVQEEIPL